MPAFSARGSPARRPDSRIIWITSIDNSEHRSISAKDLGTDWSAPRPIRNARTAYRQSKPGSSLGHRRTLTGETGQGIFSEHLPRALLAIEIMSICQAKVAPAPMRGVPEAALRTKGGSADRWPEPVRVRQRTVRIGEFGACQAMVETLCNNGVSEDKSPCPAGCSA